jgi:GT2 family glycosyltransferase
MNFVLSFIILSMNSEKYLDRCFKSIISRCSNENLSYEIIVIDNGSTDSSLNILKHYSEIYPYNFRSIFFTRNMGTTHTRNIGLKKALGKYICILDSDTQIIEGSFCDVFQILDSDPNISIVAPRLMLADGQIQKSIKKFPTFWHKILKLPQALFAIKLKDFDFYSDFPFRSKRPVESAISACWFFRKDLILNVGYLDENIFYSPEDIEYCMRIYKLGMKIIYFPDFVVLHDTQQISHRDPFSILSIKHFFGLIYYFKKHGGWFYIS